MEKIFIEVKHAAAILKNIPAPVRSAAINRIGELILNNAADLTEANRLDLKKAGEDGLSGAILSRLTLTPEKIASIAEALFTVAEQPDPIGKILGGSTRPNGLKIVKLRVPLGVIGVIYESRPNVTADCAALALRSGNAAILRGGKEAIHSNFALAAIITSALKETGIPENSVILIEDADRSKLAQMLKADGYIDLIIPRGGEALIKYVTENSSVPVVKHDKGVCNIYVDKDADFEKALKIINTAKTGYPGACNAAECVIVHKDALNAFLPLLAENLGAAGVKLLGCERAAKFDGVTSITGDWGKEYLDLTLAVRVEDSLADAADFIGRYGSSHSDAIITENYTTAEEFLKSVDSACVYVNASTRFTDGGEFGLGAEVGISTQKLHARGPMGADDLTTYKYIVYGNGQIRE
jgi:glutamate-5-semialdehyde dehydrogenase